MVKWFSKRRPRPFDREGQVFQYMMLGELNTTCLRMKLDGYQVHKLTQNGSKI